MALSNMMCGLGVRDFDKKFFTKTKPEKEQMVGIYLPTEDTQKLIRSQYDLDVKDISISLYLDGTFEMKSMPDWWATDFGDSNGGVDTGKGQWRIDFDEYDGGYWNLFLNFETGTFSSGERIDTWVDIGNNQPPYSIWLYIGDPDDGIVMIFEQVTENLQ